MIEHPVCFGLRKGHKLTPNTIKHKPLTSRRWTAVPKINDDDKEADILKKQKRISVRPAATKGYLSVTMKFRRELINDIAGRAGYEKRIQELLRVGRERRALKFAKKRLGTHRRAINKRKQMDADIRRKKQRDEEAHKKQHEKEMKEKAQKDKEQKAQKK